MSRYDDYWKELGAYADAHPYTGSAQWSMPGENNMDWSGNDELGRWDSKVFADWHNSLTPENRAEFDEMRAGSVAANRKHFNNGALLTQLMIGGMAGAGALGAMGGLGGMGGFGGAGAAGAEGLAAADIAGGLIPAFGTEAGYAAGLGGLAGAGGIGGAELAGIAGNNISAWLPAGTEALGAGTAAVPTWALPGGASAAELAGMGLGGAGSAGGSSWLSQLGSLLGGGGGTGGAGGLGGIGGSGGGSIPGLDGYYTGTGGVDGSLIGSGVTNNTGATSGFSSWMKGLSPETVKNLTSLFGGTDSLVKGLFSLYQSNKFSELGKGTPAQQTANSQLDALLKDPNQIYKMPGWEAGLEAIQRTGAGQGYLGSGNMMLSLNKYGGDFYNDTVGRLNTIATGGQNVQAGYNAGSTDLFGQGANSLGYWMSKYGKSIFDLIGD